jgi:hypothetical protein
VPSMLLAAARHLQAIEARPQGVYRVRRRAGAVL